MIWKRSEYHFHFINVFCLVSFFPTYWLPVKLTNVEGHVAQSHTYAVTYYTELLAG